MKELTLGSLFAGIGAFETAAAECGIRTLWNCEIEPYCRLVLRARFPDAVQYDDICRLDGSKIPPVDIVAFGSPCQSFSIASGDKRTGLQGKSGLFFEAARVIREMRAATSGRYPRWAVMENVPGIFSCKPGDKSDFGVVLNELLQCKNPTLAVPEPPRGQWLAAGAVVADGASIAWRSLCASKFGLAQRRKRMFLVVDYSGERAPAVLSERSGESRDFTPHYLQRQGAAHNLAAGAVAFEPGILGRLGKSCGEEIASTLRRQMGDNQVCVAYGICSNASHAMKSGNPHAGIYEAETSRTLDANGGHPGCHQGGVAICYAITTGCHGQVYEDCAPTLMARDYKSPPVVNQPRYAVRRLTPTECLRLMGLPDDHLSGIAIPAPTEADITYLYDAWEAHRRALGKKTKPRSRNMVAKWLRNAETDANAYRAIGNSLAVPCVVFVLQGIVDLTQDVLE